MSPGPHYRTNLGADRSVRTTAQPEDMPQAGFREL